MRDGAASGNSGPDAEEVTARGSGGDAGESHGNEAARLPFEQQQLDGQQHGRDRGGEHGRHAARGARHQQRLALLLERWKNWAIMEPKRRRS